MDVTAPLDGGPTAGLQPPQGPDGPTPLEGALLADAFASFWPTWARWTDSVARQSGPSYPRLRVLTALANGPRRCGKVGEELGVTAHNVTSLVDSLEGEGLLKRVPDPLDRRAVLLELTQAGRAVTSRCQPHLAAMIALFDSLTPADRGDLLRILETLRRDMARHPRAAGET